MHITYGLTVRFGNVNTFKVQHQSGFYLTFIQSMFLKKYVSSNRLIARGIQLQKSLAGLYKVEMLNIFKVHLSMTQAK